MTSSRAATLALLLTAGACAPPTAEGPSPGADSGGAAPAGASAPVDVEAWMREAVAIDADTSAVWPSDEHRARMLAHTLRLDPVVHWRQACAGEAGQPVPTSADIDSLDFAYGAFSVLEVAPEEYVVPIHCVFGMVAGTAAYVHVRGGEAALVVDGDGATERPGEPLVLFGVASVERPPEAPPLPPRSFDVFEDHRHGFGRLYTLRLDADGTARLAEVRERLAPEDPEELEAVALREECAWGPCWDHYRWPLAEPARP